MVVGVVGWDPGGGDCCVMLQGARYPSMSLGHNIKFALWHISNFE